MEKEAQETLEKYAHPPIVEVVCGVYFDELRELDPVLVGTYWAQRRTEFPGRSIQPVARAPGPPEFQIGTGTPPLRTWLIGVEGDFVLQIQPDRFYVNWRRVGAAYPRFSENGILERTLDEFEQFSKFCQKSFRVSPEARKIELSKIDHLVCGEHWSNKADLATLLPTLAPLLRATKTENPAVLVQFSEAGSLHTLQVGLSSVVDEDRYAIRLESSIVVPVAESIRDSFTEGNSEINAVFAGLIPSEQRKHRFNRQGGTGA